MAGPRHSRCDDAEEEWLRSAARVEVGSLHAADPRHHAERQGSGDRNELRAAVGGRLVCAQAIPAGRHPVFDPALPGNRPGIRSCMRLLLIPSLLAFSVSAHLLRPSTPPARAASWAEDALVKEA